MPSRSFSDRLQRALFPAGSGPSIPSRNLPAAVLAPLFYLDSNWHLLYTRRTDHLSGEHAGQVSFPGGKSDPLDRDLLDTALRETREEIGIRRSGVRVLGQLTSFPTGTGYQITPFVGQILWPYMLKISDAEVAEVFSVPVKWLSDPSHFSSRERITGPDLAVLPSIRYDTFNGHVIWGATAWITYELVSFILKIMES